MGGFYRWENVLGWKVWFWFFVGWGWGVSRGLRYRVYFRIFCIGIGGWYIDFGFVVGGWVRGLGYLVVGLCRSVVCRWGCF